MEDVSIGVLRHERMRGIAGKPPARFRGNSFAALQFTTAVVGSAGKNVSIDVYHDLKGFPALGLGRPLAQCRFGEEPQGIHSPLCKIRPEGRFR